MSELEGKLCNMETQKMQLILKELFMIKNSLEHVMWQAD